MAEQSFSKDCRLLTPNDYKAVFDKPDLRLGSKELLILVKKNEREKSRLGLVIAKKQIRMANRRNRVKRIIRESFRQEVFKNSFDIVVLARQTADLMDNKQLSDLMSHQWNRLRRKSSQ